MNYARRKYIRDSMREWPKYLLNDIWTDKLTIDEIRYVLRLYYMWLRSELPAAENEAMRGYVLQAVGPYVPELERLVRSGFSSVTGNRVSFSTAGAAANSSGPVRIFVGEVERART